MNNKPYLTLVLVGLLVCSQAGFSSQDIFVEANFKLKALKPQGFNNYQGMLTWVPVSKNSNVGFARNYISGSDEYSLVSQVFSSKGKCLLSTPLAEGKGYPLLGDAVWLAGEAQSLSHYQAPEGLVFVLFTPQHPWEPSPYGGKITLSVARFDENGVRRGDWVDLTTFKAASNYRIMENSMGISVGEDCIGVTFCAVMLSMDYRVKAEAYFLRTDFQGNPINKKPVALKVTSKGYNPTASVFRPAWNGARWLVPMAFCSFRFPTGPDGSSQAIVFASKDEKAKKFRANIVAQDKQNGFAYEHLCLVPFPPESQPSATAVQSQGLSYLLFVQHVVVRYAGKNTAFLYDYNLCPLNKKGKNAGPNVEVMLPSEPQSVHISNRLSNIVPSYGPGEDEVSIQSEDNYLYIAQTKAISGIPLKQWFNFYAINPEDGSVATLAQCVKNYHAWIFRSPQLRGNGKLIEVINHTRPPSLGSWDERVTYFSKFKK